MSFPIAHERAHLLEQTGHGYYAYIPIAVGVIVPSPAASASKNAAPKWEQIATGRSYEWHDHRIQWMSTIDPPMVRSDPDRPRRVFGWTVQSEIGGEPS